MSKKPPKPPVSVEWHKQSKLSWANAAARRMGLKKSQHAPDGPVVVPKTVKVQVCPAAGFDSRYQVDPASRPFGAGFSAVGIGRDIETGRPWAPRG